MLPDDAIQLRLLVIRSYYITISKVMTALDTLNEHGGADEVRGLLRRRELEERIRFLNNLVIEAELKLVSFKRRNE